MEDVCSNKAAASLEEVAVSLILDEETLSNVDLQV